MTDDGDRSHIEDLLYYLYLLAGRGYNGSFTIWMYEGRISRSTFQRLKAKLRLAGIPYHGADHKERSHAEVGV